MVVGVQLGQVVASVGFVVGFVHDHHGFFVVVSVTGTTSCGFDHVGIVGLLVGLVVDLVVGFVLRRVVVVG